MKRLQKEDLIFINNAIKTIMHLLVEYDISHTAPFTKTLTMISNNIDICIRQDCFGLEELNKYIYEDWRNICISGQKLENWHLKMVGYAWKRDINQILEGYLLSIDDRLETNYIIPKKWFTQEELKRISTDFKGRESVWNRKVEELKTRGCYVQSPDKKIPNDIWAYMKAYVGGTNSELIKWFEDDIPAFGYLAPMELLEMENGDQDLKSFLLDMPI